MKKLVSTSLLILLFMQINVVLSKELSGKENSLDKLKVEFNKNIEFLGFVMHMGWLGPENDTGIGEFPTTGRHAYGLKVYHQYKSYSQNPHLVKIRELGTYLDYDPAVRTMLLVDDFPNAKVNDQFSEDDIRAFSPNKEFEEGRQILYTLLEEFNQFYQEVNFDQYMEDSKEYYNAALTQISKVKPKDDLVDRMEVFYQKSFDQYMLIPSLLIPTGMGFGQKLRSGNSITVYNVFGAFDDQNVTKFDLGFDNKTRMLELSIHEFGHSFVNPVVDQIPDSIIASTSYLFDPIRSAMDNQGYYSWKTCLYEHFVRAGEVMISKEMGGVLESENLKNYYINDRKFIYLPQIMKELERYRTGKFSSYHEVIKHTLLHLEEEDH